MYCLPVIQWVYKHSKLTAKETDMQVNTKLNKTGKTNLCLQIRHLSTLRIARDKCKCCKK